MIKLNKNNENVGVISIGETAKHIVQLAYDECCDIISTDIDITQLKSTRNEVDGLICFRNFIKRIAQDGMFCNYVKSKDIVIVFSSIGKKIWRPGVHHSTSYEKTYDVLLGSISCICD